MNRRVLAAVAVAVLFAVPACEDDQDPGLVDPGGPRETSDTLGACPPGGPDATTPAAGCLDEDGTVVRP